MTDDVVSGSEPVVIVADPAPASVAAPKAAPTVKVSKGSTAAPSVKVIKGSSSAPAAKRSIVTTTAASRADHKHKKDGEDKDDTESDAEGDDSDCGSDDIGDAPDADDDDEDCTGATPAPEPCDDDAESHEDGDDEGDDCETPAPEPADEVCGDNIDNNEDGKVDENCETPEPPAPPAPPGGGAKPVVLPKKIDRLPKTGVGAGSLFLIGMALLAAGGALRLKPRSPRLVFAGQGSAAELILVQYLDHVAKQRPIRSLQ